jgi:hypothetical protein
MPRIQLAAEIPTAVLADMLGFHVTTATKWVERARRQLDELCCQPAPIGGATT